jgi:uncharacterized protein
MAYIHHSKIVDAHAKTVWAIMTIAAILFAGPLLGECLSQQQPSSTASNKELINKAFADWKQGKGTPFDLLAADVTWTVGGSSPVSATYHSKQEFLDKAVTPIRAKLSTPIMPEVESIVADGDRVVVLWHGKATALDGKPYHNTYLWHLTFANGSIIKGTALLDTYVLNDLMTRVSTSK